MIKYEFGNDKTKGFITFDKYNWILTKILVSEEKQEEYTEIQGYYASLDSAKKHAVRIFGTYVETHKEFMELIKELKTLQ